MKTRETGSDIKSFDVRGPHGCLFCRWPLTLWPASHPLTGTGLTPGNMLLSPWWVSTSTPIWCSGLTVRIIWNPVIFSSLQNSSPNLRHWQANCTGYHGNNARILGTLISNVGDLWQLTLQAIPPSSPGAEQLHCTVTSCVIMMSCCEWCNGQFGIWFKWVAHSDGDASSGLTEMCKTGFETAVWEKKIHKMRTS